MAAVQWLKDVEDIFNVAKVRLTGNDSIFVKKQCLGDACCTLIYKTFSVVSSMQNIYRWVVDSEFAL